jgi:tryptophan synthase alpha chain
MNSIDQIFQRLRSQGRKAFIPFVTAGDPDLEMTVQLVRELAACGASLVEIGFPYSDPIADGPVIQASYTRALANKLTLEAIFNAISSLTHPRPGSPVTGLPPLVAMVSYAIVFRHGIESFVRDAKAAGFAGAIVPDLPVEECGELSAIAAREDFKMVLLVAPTTPHERALEIARASTGFIYFVSVVGITGERATIPPGVLDQIAWLKQHADLPVCIGFGISRPEHVRMFAPVSDGVIVGSAIVRRITEAAGRPREQLVREIGEFVAPLIAAAND